MRKNDPLPTATMWAKISYGSAKFLQRQKGETPRYFVHPKLFLPLLFTALVGTGLSACGPPLQFGYSSETRPFDHVLLPTMLWANVDDVVTKYWPDRCADFADRGGAEQPFAAAAAAVWRSISDAKGNLLPARDLVSLGFQCTSKDVCTYVETVTISQKGFSPPSANASAKTKSTCA